MKKSVYYWAPCLDRVGTEKSAKNSATAFAKYSKNFEVSIINVFGEWSEFDNFFRKNKVNVINLGPNIYKFLPKKGFLLSRLSYVIVFFINFFPLLKLLINKKPDYLITHLITSLPISLFKIFSIKTKLVLRISGYPQLNFMRKLFWKMASNCIHFITCPSEELLGKLKKKNLFPEDKIYFLPDAILDIKEFILKKYDESSPSNFDLNQKYFLSIGRLSKQKNFTYLIEEFKLFKDETSNKDIKLLLIGNGEEKNKLINKIKYYGLTNEIKLIERTENVYKFMRKCEAFILPSLWEEVGFVIVEAALSNSLIISSDCPNGPSEFLDSGKSGILFKNNEYRELSNKLKLFVNDQENQIKKRKYTKLNCKKYTKFRHYQIFNNLINENKI